MKKLIILLLSIALISSTVSPFLVYAETPSNELLPQTELAEESLQLTVLGEEEAVINPSSKEFSIELAKNSKLKETTISLTLPKGISYEENQSNAQFNEGKSELSVDLDGEISSTSIKLKIDEQTLTSSEASLKASLKTADSQITSNELKLQFSNNTPIDGQQEIAANAIESTKTKAAKSDHGMTTLDGIPNAPKPEKQLQANPEKADEVNVSTWAEFDAAMKNTAIHAIFVQENLTSPNNTNAAITPHSVEINGNGFYLDFKNARYYSGAAIPANTDYTVQFNYTTLYGSDYYGPINFTGAVPATSSGALVYNNITYVGAQLTASYTWDIEFTGKIENHSVAKYISPSDGSTNNNDDNGQENIEAQQIIFHEDVHYTGSTPRTRILDLVGTGGIEVGNRAYVELTSGSSPLGSYYAVNLQGALTLGDDAEFIINADGTPGAALQLTKANTSITAGKNSKLTINEPNQTGGSYSIYMAGVNSSIHLKENAEMTINATDLRSSYPVLYMGNYTSFVVEDGAKLTIDVNNYTGGLPTIQVYGNAEFIVKDNAEFNVHETNKGTTGGNIIDVGANSKFIIGKKAVFDITSDGSANYNLIYLGANSTFQFTDAQKVNMQFTNDKLNTNARLINMASGTLDVDVQDVKAWNRTNISSNGEREADNHWTPMFSMIAQYSGGNSTVKQAESVMNSVRDDYIANFKTQNYSRLLYSYIEDVEVGIKNEPNDNVDLEDSSVIHGVANPGAYIRLTGDDALPDPKIPSIVDGSNHPELTDDFTVIADENGKFTAHAKDGKHFTAENEIKAYAFLGGKIDEATIKVLDKTAPTAEGKALTMVVGTDFPSAQKFIMNEADTNPQNEGYTYEFKEDYHNLANTLGTHNILINLKDDAGNTRTIPATIEVVANAFVIEADDFTVHTSQLKQYDTAEKLNNFLLEESKAQAYGIIDFEKQELTTELSVKDTTSIEQFKKGKYPIILQLTNEGEIFTKTFTVTVLNDEAVAPTNPEKPGSEEKPSEQENNGTAQTGLLKLDYAPSTFNFGTLAFGFQSTEAAAIKTTSDEQWLQVSDDRDTKSQSNWSIQVSQNHPLQNKAGEQLNGATITIPKGNAYTEAATGKEHIQTNEVSISTSPTTIFSTTNAENTTGMSTNVWQATDVKLTIPGNQDFKEDDYSNEITWSLVSEAENE